MGASESVALTPSATEISVPEVLAKFDGAFESVANGLAKGEFALWVGSGISRKAPSLGGLIERAIEFLRQRAINATTQAVYLPAFESALQLARVAPNDVMDHYSIPFTSWPLRETIVSELWNKYSRLLDVRIRGEPSDFMLWDAVDIRAAFSNPASPSVQHLCIAILILEGAVKVVASANWDGFIETAVARLCGGTTGILQVVVDPNHLRGAASKAKLLKFHGCIVHAADDQVSFRKYLTGSHTQITEWPDNQNFTSMRNAVTDIATNQKSLVLGLSIQDANLQGVFSAAKRAHPWPWPCAPDAPGHVFCEDVIMDGQRDVLKIVYGDAYNDNIDEIEAGTHLRAWAEQVLIALVFRLVEDKLARLMALTLDVSGKSPFREELARLLKSIRNDTAAFAVGDRTDFANSAIASWSRILSIFRTGALPTLPEAYEVLTTSALEQLAVDQNARASCLGHLAIGLSLLQHGRTAAHWELSPPATSELSSGSLTAKASWPGATERTLFFVKGAGEAIALEKYGAFTDDNAIVVHADDAWLRMAGDRSTARRPRNAPGRTGRVGTRHVSLSNLVERCGNIDDLKQLFLSEVTL